MVGQSGTKTSTIALPLHPHNAVYMPRAWTYDRGKTADISIPCRSLAKRDTARQRPEGVALPETLLLHEYPASSEGNAQNRYDGVYFKKHNLL